MAQWTHTTRKADLVGHLKAIAGKSDSAALAAIEALGELGGSEAIMALGQLIDEGRPGFQNSSKGLAIIKAIGRAGRTLSE